MTALIVSYGLAAFTFLLSVLGRQRIVQRVATSTEDELKDFRQMMETAWTGWYIAILGFLSAVGGTFLVVRGHLIGIGWWGAAVLYAVAVAAIRRRRAEILSLIGDRGRTIRSTRNEHRMLVARRFAAVGVLSYVAIKVLEYAYPEPLPDGAAVAIGLVGIVAVIAAAGWLVMRTLVYLALDEDKRAARQQGSS